MGRRIRIIDLISKNSLLAQDVETVSESLRDKKLTFILVRQLYGNILPKCRRTFAQIDSHIQHTSFYHTYQLGLRVRSQLVMQTSQHAFRRTRLVILHKFHFADMLFKLSLLPSFHKITACIFKNFRFNDPHAGNFSFNICHYLIVYANR